MKTVCVLGSTGSIGQNTLDVIRHHPEKFRVVGLAAGERADILAEQVAAFDVAAACICNAERAEELSSRITAAIRSHRPQAAGAEPVVFAGAAGLVELVEACRADIVVGAITGAAGMPPNLRAVQLGARLALANKESLVMAGDLFTRQARETGAEIVPVDSEHSALFQALQAGRRQDVKSLILTASGGPFRCRDRSTFDTITVAQALNHPTWAMGPKVTIDSATMMNKTLEVLEARWLFDFPPEQIEVVVHPQSLVHSMVEFVDGSIVAQMSVPDMRLPIQYALTFPERLSGGPMAPFRVRDFATLTFEPADADAFPAIRFGFEAGRKGGTLGAVLNAANEIAVERFLANRDSRRDAIRFTDIAALVADVMDAHTVISHPTLADILDADATARAAARDWSPR